MMLIDRVAVARRFQRATRVDIDSPVDAVEGFITTPTAASVLRTTLRHLAERGQGAFTWTGPYGCGKSSLAAVLAALLGPGAEARAAAAGALGADLTSELYGLMGGDPEFRVIPVVGARRDVEDAIREALTVAGVKPTAGGVVADLLKMVRGGRRVLLIVDEMGKTLEHVAMEGGDVHLFQELAEAASRSDGRLLVIGILHQAFDDYAHRLAREARDEWLKVQGRFVDVPVNLAGEEQLELISRAIVTDVADVPETLMASVVADAVTAGRRGSADGLRERLERCWPLNPVVANLLGPLSRRRFGQNQRSIFGFLNSAEPFGFQDFLANTPADGGSLYDTDWLWSYLRSNLEPSILASPDGHRWSTAVDAVERCEARGSDPAQIRIVKTVALVDMLRERSGLVPSLDVIGAANPDLEPHQIERLVEGLKSLSILIDRRHLGSVSIYAGSDFDLDEALTRARAESGDVDLSHLRTIGVLAPVLAKRHYHQTGALRWFDVDVATTDEAAERIERYSASKGATGLFLLLINAAGEDKKRLAATFKRLRDGVGDRPIALGLASDGYTLRELAIELVAYDRIAATRPELRGDPVARRELSGATARCAAELEDRLRASLDATSWRVPVLGEEGIDLGGAAGAARLAAIASEIARKLYPESPRVANELLNRTKPSSNAVAAMRALMHAMVARSTEPRLGIKDFPAEGGLYASILEEAGLHRADGDGFRFAAPAGEDPCNLRFAWQKADEMLKAAGPGAPLGRLHDLWRDRPIGMREGLLPVLSLAYIMSRLDRVTIYLDEVFSPSASDFLVDRMMQNPDAIRLRWSEFSEQQVENVTAVARVVSTATGSLVPAGDPLAVSRALVGLVLGVSPWTLRTMRLSPTARRVRDLGKKASDPNKLLLDDLPQLLAADGDDEAVDVAGTVGAGLRELMDAYGAMIDEVRTAMLEELRASDDQLEELHERAATVIALTGNYRLDAFATRLSTFDGGVEAVEGLASLAANKPTRDWVDRDVDAAKVELAALAQEFLRAEGLAHVKGRRGRRVRIAVFVSEPGRPALTTQEVSVSDRERARARELAEELRAKLQGAGVSRPVMLAALAETMCGVAGEEAEVLPIDDGRRRAPGA